jgi:hypothetical protein
LDVLVCGRWVLSAPPPSAGPPFDRLPLRARQTELGRKARAYRTLVERVGRAESVTEYFGGFGMTATVIRNVLRPARHVLIDNDPRCVASLRAAFPAALVIEDDAAAHFGRHPADLSCLDFNRFTLLAAVAPRSPLPAVAASSRAGLIVTETGIFRLHLNRPSYSRAAGRPVVTPADYFAAWADLAPPLRLAAVAYHATAAFLLFLPAPPPGPPDLLRVAGRDGFESAQQEPRPWSRTPS